MIVPIYNNNSNSIPPDEDGCCYFEGQASTEAEVAAFTTLYKVGSMILCSGDDADGEFSIWVLCLDSTNSNQKVWKKVELVT